MAGCTIETPRLQIMPFSGDYISERYVNWLNDPTVVRYSEQRHRVHTLESCRSYWASFAGTPNHFWAIVVRDATVGHIGNITAHVDTLHSVANVGILIGERSRWGNGYGLEAWKAVCGYLLNDAGIRKVEAGTLSVNTAMRSIMRGSGMEDDGVRRRQMLWEGQEVDIVFAALYRNPRL